MRPVGAGFSPSPANNPEIAALEARRLITAGIAIAGIVTLTVAALRVLS